MKSSSIKDYAVLIYEGFEEKLFLELYKFKSIPKSFKIHINLEYSNSNKNKDLKEEFLNYYIKNSEKYLLKDSGNNWNFILMHYDKDKNKLIFESHFKDTIKNSNKINKEYYNEIAKHLINFYNATKDFLIEGNKKDLFKLKNNWLNYDLDDYYLNKKELWIKTLYDKKDKKN